MFSNTPVSEQDQVALPLEIEKQNKALFEQLLLFDTVSFRVSGENVPLAILISQIGLKGVEKLVEERAIKFVLWTQNVFTLVTDIPGIHPLQSGKMNTGAHSDPEQSAELGLKWLSKKLPSKKAKHLLKRVVPLYEPQPDDLAADAVSVTHSAYQTGRLKCYGLNPNDAPLENVPTNKRNALLQCATELLEYKLLLIKNWSSLTNFSYFSLFSTSLDRLTRASSVTDGFRHLSEIENLPDFAALYKSIRMPLQTIPKIRTRRSSIKFRAWLAEGAWDTPADLTRSYVDAIAESSGFFDRAPVKFTKSVAMTAAGAGLGAAIEGGLSGVAAGALIVKLVEPLADLGLDLLDSFLLESLLKGWTPRIFFNSLDESYKKLTK